MNLLLPAPLGATLIGVSVLVRSRWSDLPRPENLAQGALVITGISFCLAIIPSFLGALWMERSYRRGRSAATARALVHSGVWGALSGAAIAGYLFRPFTLHRSALAGIFVLVALGAVTGLVVGGVVWIAENRAVSGKR